MRLQGIQRRRVKGWRMPPRTLYVGRPSIYANPFRAGGWAEPVQRFREWWVSRGWVGGILMYEDQMDLLMGAMFQTDPHPFDAVDYLACWCPEGEPCHRDVLIEIYDGLFRSSL